jgi:NADPH-dependent glutamate synthase beta subunit-like oxidoreductase/NAD(P)H-flavin reductase
MPSATSQESRERDFDLGIDGFRFSHLFDPARLRDLGGAFERFVERNDAATAAGWQDYARTLGAGMDPKKVSELIIAKARLLSPFLAKLFHCEKELRALMDRAAADTPVFRFKRDFVRRRVLAKFKDGDAAAMDLAALERDVRDLWSVIEPTGDPNDETSAARGSLLVLDLRAQLAGSKSAAALAAEGAEALARAAARAAEIRAALAARRPDFVGIDGAGGGVPFLDALLDRIERWIFARVRHPDSAHSEDEWVSYRQPRNLDYQHLVHVERPRADLPELAVGPAAHRRERDGFHLTDPRWNPLRVLGDTHYCLLCHDREKDSCSKGFVAPAGGYTNNPLGVPLAGCPLDEKISEMHAVRRDGDSLAALAIVAIDNPMCAGTGHRICNDCMKGCIFQKQEPVNIPQIETGVLVDVLRLPYGFEIYGLLTRWNPLDPRRPYQLPYNGKKVLVVGLGPAGYTLSHYLLRDGFGVVGIDGLKIEPLATDLTGADGKTPRAVKHYTDLEVDLASRPLVGFGGVSEYGITVRWDKNFLTAIYLTLARQRHFQIHGGVRFGGTITLGDAWKLGFDHVAIAAGAGKPTIVEFENNLIRGIRKASDFLMALQLTGAFRRDSLSNLQVRLPAIVIGGGLTAIDTATELLAYYVVQVEKVLERFEALAAVEGEEKLVSRFDREEKQILEEALEHGRAVRAERAAARAEEREPRFGPLLDRWGGASIVYRRTMQESPAYRLNHEEIEKCLEEGVRFVERLSPKKAIADEYGAVAAMEFARDKGGESVSLPARTVCVAAGTSPNTTYERELPGAFAVDAKKAFFKPHRVVAGPDGRPILEEAPASAPGAFFTSHQSDGRFVSYYGDNHPKYAGSVVKAMASARDGAPHVSALFEKAVAGLDPIDQPERETRWRRFAARLDDALVPRVVAVNRLTPTIVEVVVRAPFAAERFHPGQFYRLQNYESNSPRASLGSSSAVLAMEGIALTGAWHDPEKGLLSLIILEMGVSSRLCAHLKVGEAVVVMGPTGAPTEIPKNETVVLCGGGLGNAVLFSIAKALRQNGCKVIYFAGYKKPEDVFKRDDIEAATDQVVWSTDVAPAIAPRRPQDRAFVGNIVQAMVAFAEGKLGSIVAPLSEATRIIAIGSDRMMAALARARHEALAPHLSSAHVGIGSINSPMQCMMKEVCAQCLQRHVDPKTGKETFVFSCFNQDQELDRVDWKHLAARLRQNTVQEKLTNLWLTHALERSGARHQYQTS